MSRIMIERIVDAMFLIFRWATFSSDRTNRVRRALTYHSTC